MAVDERGEDVMSDEICRRRNRKQTRRRRGGRSVQLLDWVIALFALDAYDVCSGFSVSGLLLVVFLHVLTIC